MANKKLGVNNSLGKNILTAIMSVISIIYILPVVAVVINSFKANTFAGIIGLVFVKISYCFLKI